MSDAKGPRWGTVAQLRIILLLSLGLNLFLGGYWLGSYLNRSMHSLGPGPGGPGRLQAIAERLRGQISPDAMHKIDGLVVEIDTIFRDRRPGGGDVRSQIQQIVADSQFDQQKFMDVIERLNSVRTSSDREIASRIASVLSQLSPQDRRVLANVVLTQIVPPPPPGR